jgi:hypothetical protein
MAQPDLTPEQFFATHCQPGPPSANAESASADKPDEANQRADLMAGFGSQCINWTGPIQSGSRTGSCAWRRLKQLRGLTPREFAIRRIKRRVIPRRHEAAPICGNDLCVNAQQFVVRNRGATGALSRYRTRRCTPNLSRRTSEAFSVPRKGMQQGEAFPRSPLG